MKSLGVQGSRIKVQSLGFGVSGLDLEAPSRASNFTVPLQCKDERKSSFDL